MELSRYGDDRRSGGFHAAPINNLVDLGTTRVVGACRNEFTHRRLMYILKMTIIDRSLDEELDVLFRVYDRILFRSGTGMFLTFCSPRKILFQLMHVMRIAALAFLNYFSCCGYVGILVRLSG